MKAEFGPCLLSSIRWRNIQFSCTVRLMIVRRLNQQLAKIISKTERLNPWWICAFCGQAGGKKTSEETYNTIIFIEQGIYFIFFILTGLGFWIVQGLHNQFGSGLEFLRVVLLSWKYNSNNSKLNHPANIFVLYCFVLIREN